MIFFDAQNLFGSGPSRLHVGALALRHHTEPVPHADGTTLIAQGREARPITQTGTLLADDTVTMTGKLAAIESRVDGIGRTLTDDTGRVWEGVVMLRFDPGPVVSLGPRCRVDYTIDYLQVTP